MYILVQPLHYEHRLLLGWLPVNSTFHLSAVLKVLELILVVLLWSDWASVISALWSLLVHELTARHSTEADLLLHIWSLMTRVRLTCGLILIVSSWQRSCTCTSLLQSASSVLCSVVNFRFWATPTGDNALSLSAFSLSLSLFHLISDF